MISYDQEFIDKLNARIEQLQHKHTKLQDDLAQLENTADALRIEAALASNWPVNLFERLATIGFGSILATVGGYLLLVLLSRTYGAVLGRSSSRRRA